MTRKERLRRCYFHEEVDRPGVFCRRDFPPGDPSYDTLKAYLAQYTELKPRFNSARLDTPYATDTTIEAYSEGFQRRRTILHTPTRDLQSLFLEGLKGHPGYQEKYLLEDRGDAEKYLWLPMPQYEGDVAAFGRIQAELGDAGIVDVGLGLNPAGFVAELFGSQNFALMTATDRDIVHALCQRQMTILLNRLKFLRAHNIGPFFSMAGEEYIVPPLHGPHDFRDFNLRYDKPIIDLVHEMGGRMHIHCHGRMKTVLPMFVEMGTDVLHPFEPPPMGDITAKQAKQLARGKICLEGNIQINRMYEATPEDIHQETAALIAAAFDDRRGLIVCPSASPYIPGAGEQCLPRFQAMIQTVLDFKG
jgi:hypothetical protein